MVDDEDLEETTRRRRVTALRMEEIGSKETTSRIGMSKFMVDTQYLRVYL